VEVIEKFKRKITKVSEVITHLDKHYLVGTDLKQIVDLKLYKKKDEGKFTLTLAFINR